MKLFVWEEVLCDYTCGMMFAIANDVEDARNKLIEKCNYLKEEDLSKEPQVFEVTEPIAFYVWGGG